MRKGFVMAFVFVMFGLSFAVACEGGDDQLIMRLYDSANSHVSAWNEN